jgi:hypothetical protein
MKDMSELMSDAELAYSVWRQAQKIRTSRMPTEWQYTQAKTQGLWIHAARLADMEKERQGE